VIQTIAAVRTRPTAQAPNSDIAVTVPPPGSAIGCGNMAVVTK
jgi:hypothetical protein